MDLLPHYSSTWIYNKNLANTIDDYYYFVFQRRQNVLVVPVYMVLPVMKVIIPMCVCVLMDTLGFTVKKVCRDND